VASAIGYKVNGSRQVASAIGHKAMALARWRAPNSCTINVVPRPPPRCCFDFPQPTWQPSRARVSLVIIRSMARPPHPGRFTGLGRPIRANSQPHMCDRSHRFTQTHQAGLTLPNSSTDGVLQDLGNVDSSLTGVRRDNVYSALCPGRDPACHTAQHAVSASQGPGHEHNLPHRPTCILLPFESSDLFSCCFSS